MKHESLKITAPQRISIMKLWQQVCRDRKWSASNRELRLVKFGEILGRELASSDDIGRIDECTKLMNELKVLLGISVEAGIEAEDLTINKARTIRHQIVNELVPCLELYLEDVRAFMTEIMADKNRWWKLDRPARDITLNDLDAKPVIRWSVKQKRMAEFPSQLEQLQYTLAARLNTKRNEAGDTIHDMKIKAHVPCSCAECKQAGEEQFVPEPEAAGQPF